MSSINAKYVVITPVRDEEENIRHTLDCMIAQTVIPTEWIIVNDGSTDDTGRIIDDYASRHSWIRALHRVNRGFRKPGGGVVEAFNEGLQTMRTVDWDFLVKFDGDLSFEQDYFERCFDEFAANPQLGVGGGTICHLVGGVEKPEEAPEFHVRGATKIYRRQCWEAIGSLLPAPGWDTMDEIKANSLGWKTKSFKNLRLRHHRVTGTADGFWGALVKYGRANYICGYHPAFMIAKCIRRLVAKPPIVGSLALMYGYVSGYLKGIPQVDDPEAIGYLRRQQIAKLMGQASIWK
jgi:glycosyltransferase involved in cell wall biosynthesis